MPHHEKITLNGVIENVFVHRFTVLSNGQIHLADLGPKGAEVFPLAEGLKVTLEGEQRPSEIKVLWISKKGGRPVDVEHKKPRHSPKHHHADVAADPKLVLKAVGKAGWTVEGTPERKPKHFEVLAYQGGGDWTELHVDFAGVIYKEKPADAHKWGIEA
ncbi:hypothetical protein SAMN05428989_2941 [Pseudoxanthomonas sp. GM95]|uniref:hypothetical protein n=1 Tax=Pseudoxanthomonas sp. GM95 TaxID=1881043 RepID=UPI0008C15FC5|nr:hypothetical protein [Pseudoxanthomonas sp. GM95]SEL94279.1 hypothetical protein SAMN05428989_2941 [Pseudoxanthomonas sp. GM95]